MSVVLAVLVFVMLVSLQQQSLLLGEVVRTNAELEGTTKVLKEEKARMDVLLVRQYGLIKCFSDTKAPAVNDLLIGDFSREGSAATFGAQLPQRGGH